MQTGPDMRVKCPYCGAVKELISLISGNTIGGVHWSDMKTIYLMLPNVSQVQRCPECGKYYFLEDAKKLRPRHDNPYFVIRKKEEALYNEMIWSILDEDNV